MRYTLHYEQLGSIRAGRKNRFANQFISTVSLLSLAAKKLKLNAQVDGGISQQVISQAYASDLTYGDLEQIGQDPFLVGYAIPRGTNVTVVTREVSSRTKQRQIRKMPEVCKHFGVRCITDCRLFQELALTIAQ